MNRPKVIVETTRDARTRLTVYVKKLQKGSNETILVKNHGKPYIEIRRVDPETYVYSPPEIEA